MDHDLAHAIGQVLGDSVTRIEPVLRGYTAARRAIVGLASGRRVFLKQATSDETRQWLRQEARVYQALRAPFMPRLEGWVDDEIAPFLLLEDLGGAHWPPPWPPGSIETLQATLAELRACEPPVGLERLEDIEALHKGWLQVRADPRPFLALGLVSAQWLEAALPALLAIDARAALRGDSLVHADIRSDNVCFQGGAVKVVDWNWSCVGSPRFDLAAWLPSLAAEGGPPPQALMADSGGLSVLIAGFLAARAGLPPPPGAARVRGVQLQQLRVALPWAARELRLAAPSK